MVRQVFVRKEQLVAEGDLLLELDSRLLSLRVDQAVVMLQSARAIVALSSSRTLAPALASRYAAVEPAGPPPMIATS